MEQGRQANRQTDKHTTNLSSVMFGTALPKPKIISVGIGGVASSAEHEAAVELASCWQSKHKSRIFFISVQKDKPSSILCVA